MKLSWFLFIKMSLLEVLALSLFWSELCCVFFYNKHSYYTQNRNSHMAFGSQSGNHCHGAFPACWWYAGGRVWEEGAGPWTVMAQEGEKKKERELKRQMTIWSGHSFEETFEGEEECVQTWGSTWTLLVKLGCFFCSSWLEWKCILQLRKWVKHVYSNKLL